MPHHTQLAADAAATRWAWPSRTVLIAVFPPCPRVPPTHCRLAPPPIIAQLLCHRPLNSASGGKSQAPDVPVVPQNNEPVAAQPTHCDAAKQAMDDIVVKTSQEVATDTPAKIVG
jgi:hypothetical protein